MAAGVCRERYLPGGGQETYGVVVDGNRARQSPKDTTPVTHFL